MSNFNRRYKSLSRPAIKTVSSSHSTGPRGERKLRSTWTTLALLLRQGWRPASSFLRRISDAKDFATVIFTAYLNQDTSLPFYEDSSNCVCSQPLARVGTDEFEN